WSNIQMHCWRYSDNPWDQCALLPYQGKQCLLWHQTVGTLGAWSLAHINDRVLEEMRWIIQNKSANAYLLKLSQVSCSFPKINVGILLLISHCTSLCFPNDNHHMFP
ncbi:hypothetical protein PAXRUDRAFT_178472, partial [Paxillus rubicundulus Ve08.2h10]